MIMKEKDRINLDKEALDSLKVGECLEAEFTFPDEDESVRMKVCKTRKGLESDTPWEDAWNEYPRKKK